MCITIPSSANVGRSRSIPAWVWLTETPARLLTAAGLLSLVVWSVQLALFQGQSWNWMVFDLMFAVLPASMFGLALSKMPVWLKVTPLRYVNYGILFFLILASQLIFHLSMLFSEAPGLLYLCLLLLSWIVCLKFVKNFLSSSFIRRRFIEQALFVVLLLGGLLGGLFAALNLSAPSVVQYYLWLAGLSYLLPFVVLMAVRSLKDSPRIP